MLVPINLTGPSSKSRSPSLSNQKTLNMYPEVSAPGSKSPFVLQPWFGAKSFSLGQAPDRGIFEHKGVLHQVAGPTLYTIDSQGVLTSRGTIAGSEQVIFTALLDNVIIVVEGNVYQWDGTSLTTITDVDLESPTSADHLNQIIIFNGDGDRWVTSDVGDATSISGLNYARAESHADDIVRVYVHNQLLYLFGDITVEPWWNSGDGNPPFDRVQEGILQIGLGAKLSLSSNDQVMYFLADDKNVYRLAGSTFERISSVNIANQIQSFDTVSDARGFTLTKQGQNFYILTFPDANRTFAFNESVGKENGWFELASGGSTSDRYFGNSHAFVFGKNLVSDYRNGNIYELDEDTHDEFGDEIIRLRDSQPLHGGLVNAPGKRIEMNRFELFCETGVGTTSGEGFKPEVMLHVSDDGGRTFQHIGRGTLGQAGDFIWKVQWFGLGSFYSRIIRVSCSDPVYFAIHSAAADVQVGI